VVVVVVVVVLVVVVVVVVAEVWHSAPEMNFWLELMLSLALWRPC